MRIEDWLVQPNIKEFIEEKTAPEKEVAGISEFNTLKLRELLNLLIEHRLTFEDLREMTILELFESFQKVKSGELITYAEAAKREKEQRKAAGAAYKKNRD